MRYLEKIKIKPFFIVIMISLFIPFLNAQQEDINQKLENLFNQLDSCYTIYEKSNKSLNFNQDETNKMIKSIYELYSLHWIDVNAFIDKKVKQKEKLNKESQGQTSLQKPVLSMLRKELNKSKGKHFFEIITAPYYLKTKILNINHDKVYKSDNGLYPKTTMICEIIEVIKGPYMFKAGEQIEVSYLNNWNLKEYEKGKIYFMPIRPWDCKNGTCNEYTINLFPTTDNISIEGGPFGIYPIENNEVKNADYFNISDSNWNNFTKKFKEKYIMEINK